MSRVKGSAVIQEDTVNDQRRLTLGCAALVMALLAGGLVDRPAAENKPEGEMRWALYVTLSPVWFDPGEVVGQITPFWVLYALHDALSSWPKRAIPAASTRASSTSCRPTSRSAKRSSATSR